MAITEKQRVQEYIADSNSSLGEVARDRGDLEQARELWMKARDLYAKIGIRHMAKEKQQWLDGLPNQRASRGERVVVAGMAKERGGKYDQSQERGDVQEAQDNRQGQSRTRQTCQTGCRCDPDLARREPGIRLNLRRAKLSEAI